MRRFEEDDAGYLAWLAAHPAGFVVNAYRPPAAAYLPLHRTTCRTIKGIPASGRHWTHTTIKVCGDRGELEAWARQEVGGEVQACLLCVDVPTIGRWLSPSR